MPSSLPRYMLSSVVSCLTLTLAVQVAEAQLVINEVDYDQPSTDTAEFVELKNVGSTPLNLAGYTVRLVNGANGGSAAYQNIVLPSVSVAAGDYYLVCANAATVPNCDLDVTPDTDLIQNGAPDALALLLNGTIVDTVSYEGDVPGYTETEGATADTAAPGESIARCPDGQDSDDNASDFALRPITPGAANNCGGGGGGDPGVCGDPATLISAIQGSGSSSPLAGQTHIIEGVVVADFQDTGLNGFYVQEQDSDSDANRGDLERFEGMRITVPQTLTVTGNFEWSRYGSLDLSANGRLFQATQIAEPGAASIAQQSLNDRSRIILDDGQSTENPNPIPYKDTDNTRRLGSTVAGLAGVLDERFGAYRVQPTSAPNLVNPTARPVQPSVSGRLRVASFNVLNFFTTIDTGADICGPSGGMECRGADSATELTRQREKLLNALAGIGADIYGLTEIENNTRAATQSLVDGLNARLGANTYAFVDTGTIGTDAIKLAFLYRPARVSPSGAFALLTSAVDARFIDTRNRPALAQTFVEQGSNARLTVVLNHLKSKGSACGAGDDDTTLGQGNCNGTRSLAAAALVDWLATDPTRSGDADYLLMGDLNAYAKEDPIVTLEEGGLQNLAQRFLGQGDYTYQFQGQSGSLDYALANGSLAAQVAGTGIWHLNSDEPLTLGYNLEFKTDDPFNINDPFAASDHDPVIVGLNLTGGVPPQPVPANTPWSLLLLTALLCGTGLFASARRVRA